MPSSFYTSRSDWSSSNSSLNISCLVYHDIASHGRFDLAALPLAGIAVQLLASDKSDPLTVRSNLAGLANFAMSVTDTAAHIRSAGTRTFVVLPPPGWSITSGQARQETEFGLLPGSPSGLICLHPPEPVGLAPPLSLTGRHPTPRGEIHLVQGQQILRTAVANEQGHFCFDNLPGRGDYELHTDTVCRTVSMTHLPVHTGTLDPSRAPFVAQAASLPPIDFADISPARLAKLPHGYCYLDWNNFVLTEKTFYGGEGYINGCLSGNHVIYNGSGHAAEISHPAGFDFASLCITGAWQKAEGETVMIESFRDSQCIARDEFTLTCLAPICYSPALRHITRIRFTTTHGWQFILDHLRLRLLS